MTRNEWSHTGRTVYRITVEPTDDGRYRAYEQSTDSDLYGRGDTEVAAVEHYCQLIGERNSDDDTDGDDGGFMFEIGDGGDAP